MNFQQAVASGFKNYATFSGRASRAELWKWGLFCFLVSVSSGFLDFFLFPGILLGEGLNAHGPLDVITTLALIVPNIAVCVRRLHDVNRSGWWMLIAFTVIGLFFPLLVWWCIKGTEGENRFGPAPASSDAGH